MTQDEIRKLIPHHGDMCLLERLESWDTDSIVCYTRSHQKPDNPLLRNQQLNVVTGVEYAGQAMALHGGLTDRENNPGARPRQGYLASVRNVEFHCATLDDIDADLRVSAQRLAGGADSYMYAFEITAEGQVLLSGRAAVALLADGEST
ncbi:MAG: phosphotransferase [Gammaproteobacteria bacterium]|nr:MAG: phosphotransferase [Gammaproteobacteria bacterium]